MDLGTSSVVVRPTTPADVDPLRAFVTGLSLECAYRRFFCGVGTPSASWLRRLVARGPDRGAWVAVGPTGAVLGHAQWTRLDGHDGHGGGREHESAEVAVVVTDAVQRCGIGSRVGRAAVEEAAAAGVRRLRAEVQGDNRLVLRLLHRRWPGALPRREGAALVYDLPVDPVAERRATQPSRWSSTIPVACMRA